MTGQRPEEKAWVTAVQMAMLAGFTAYALGVVLWVAHLLRTALRWHDSFSASVGISVVAIPVFLVLLGLVQYVFWGLRRHRSDGAPAHRPAGPDGGAAPLLWLVLPALMGSVAARAAEPLPTNPIEGWSLFVEKGCVECHSVRGAGGTRGPDLGLVGLGRSRLDLASDLWNYGPHMAAAMERAGMPYPKIDRKEMETLLPFIYLLGFFDPEPDIERGAKVYERAACRHCHGEQGQGAAAPALTSVASGASAIELATAIWNHGPTMAAEARKLGLSFPHFAGRDLVDMVGYLRDVALPSEEPLRLQRVGNPQRGRALLDEKGCLACHSLDGVGGSDAPDFGASEDLARSQTLLVTALWNHGPEMWRGMKEKGMTVPRLGEDEMADLLSALFFVRFDASTSDVGAGQRAFLDKGCASCHAVSGAATTPPQPPDLARSELLESDYQVAAAVWNHLPKMYERMEEQSRAWPSFAPGELGNLVAYLRSVKK